MSALSPEARAEVARLLTEPDEAGLPRSLARVAHLTRLTRDRVREVANGLGIERGPGAQRGSTNRTRKLPLDEVAKLRADGKTAQEIAKVYKVSREAVRQTFVKLDERARRLERTT